MNRIATGALVLLPWMIVACAGPSSTSEIGVSAGSGGSGGGGQTAGAGAGGPGSNGAGTGALPCAVASVLQAKCQSCHGPTPLFGAPMSLVTYADTQAAAQSNPALKVWDRMRTRVHAGTMPMPPVGQPSLTTAELAALDAWFGASAPAGQPCGGGGGGSTGTGSGATGGGGAGGVVGPGAGIGPQYLPCTPNRIMTAHAANSLTTKYPVPNPTNDRYVCFNFKSPFAAGEQATAWAPIIDDARVIHHWILYGTTSAVTDGSVSTSCQATSLGGTHVAGWAPGGNNSVFDDDIGLVLDYPYYQLQIHYNNQRYADGADASGVAFCTTNTPRANAAGIVTLGTMFFNIPAGANDFPVNSTCSNLAADGKTPMTIIGTSPHMHLLGTGFRTQHMRGSSNMGDISNVPIGTWSFDGQKHYTIPRRQVLPGDKLLSTCYFDNPGTTSVGFGTKTSDEMCFDFITVYPYAAATKSCSSLF